MAQVQHPGGTAPRKPSKTGIIWAIVIFAVTAVIGIVMIVISIGTIANAIGDLQRVDAGQSKTLTLTPGDQYVFVGADNRRDLNDVTVAITDEAGDPVRLRSGNSYTSDNNDQQFESLGYIDVTSTMTVDVTVDGPPGGTVRIGEIPIGRFVGLLVGGIVIGGLGFVVALVILIVALVRRSRVKKENRTAAYASSPYGQPGYGQQPPAPGYGQQPPAPQPPASSPPPPPAAPGPSGPPPESWPPPSAGPGDQT